MDKSKSPLYFQIDGDNRWHINNKLLLSLLEMIPNYWEDTCPICGNTKGINGCRCPINHRYCSCGAEWHYVVDYQYGVLTIVVDKEPPVKE